MKQTRWFLESLRISYGHENKLTKHDVTSTEYLFPISARPFLVRFRKALGSRRIFLSWAPRFAQKQILRVDSASCWYDWCFWQRFSTKEKFSKFRCIWPLSTSCSWSSFSVSSLSNRSCSILEGFSLSLQGFSCNKHSGWEFTHARSVSTQTCFAGLKNETRTLNCSSLTFFVLSFYRRGNPKRKKRKVCNSIFHGRNLSSTPTSTLCLQYTLNKWQRN